MWLNYIQVVQNRTWAAINLNSLNDLITLIVFLAAVHSQQPVTDPHLFSHFPTETLMDSTTATAELGWTVYPVSGSSDNSVCDFNSSPCILTPSISFAMRLYLPTLLKITKQQSHIHM